ncbi:MAG TPA: hypothetical protein VFX45_09015 [Solirubrobacterales bacterium]|nr:hypothetical protein [Solirubrobacterales bacterium]
MNAALAKLDRNRPLAGLAAAMAAAAVLMLALGSGLTFIQDTWFFLLQRPGFSAETFFGPHNEHIVAIPVGIEKLLVELFGTSSALPERLVLVALLLTTAALVFVYARRRVGPWPALIAAVLLLFLGPAWSVLLWPFETVLVGSVLAGVGMLLALDRDDRRGDIWACLLLVVAVGFSSLGVAFLAAAAADLLLRRRQRGLARVWVVAVPALLYLGWYLGWGHTSEHHVTLDNVLRSPVYTLNGFASALAALLGLSTIDVSDVGQPEWGRPLLVGAIGLVLYGQTRRRGFSPRLWPVLAAAVAYWLLAAFNYQPGRDAVAGRYSYAGAVFVLLIAAELLRGVRFSRAALWVGAGVAAVAVVSNLAYFRMGEHWLRDLSVLTRADTAAIEIAGRTVAPDFSLTPEVAGTASLQAIRADSYLEMVRDHGSPAYSATELAAAPATARRQADIVLTNALPVTTETQAGAYRRGVVGACDNVSGDAEIELSPGLTRVEIAPGPDVSIGLRRFAAGEYPVETDGIPGGSVTLLRIPRDGAPQPWFLQVRAEQPAQVCR